MESSGQGWKAMVVLCPEKMKAYGDTLKEIVGFSMSKFPRKVGHRYFQDLIVLCLWIVGCARFKFVNRSGAL